MTSDRPGARQGGVLSAVGEELPVRLHRLSMRLHRRGHVAAAKAVKAAIFLAFRAILPPEIAVGRNLRLGHYGLGVVIHPNTTIGDDVFLHHHVTLAADLRLTDARRQVLGSRVTVGVGATILGPIRLGDDVMVGAGAVVTHDVPSGHVVAGVPARIISDRGAELQKDAGLTGRS